MSKETKLLQRLLQQGNSLWDKMSPYARDVGGQMRDVLEVSTSEVLERAGDTGRSVRMRLMQRNLENQLGRVYAQIGKIVCDENRQKGIKFSDESAQEKIALAEDIIKQLELLRNQAAEEARGGRKRRGAGAQKKSAQQTGKQEAAGADKKE